MLGSIFVRRIVAIALGFLPLFSGAVAEPIQRPPLPATVPIDKDAGAGGWVTIWLRFEHGEKFRVIVDTGAPYALLDTSLEPQLGKRLASTTINSFRGNFPGGTYAAPTFYLGDVALLGGSNVFTVELKKLLPRLDPPVRGILGMDCLRHYCVQLDFKADEMRFLDDGQLDTARLGRAYPLQFMIGEDRPGLPTVQHGGLLGGGTANTLIDTGNANDALVEGRVIRQHASGSYSGGLIKRSKHFLAVEGVVNRDVGLPGCIWDGNSYTNIVVGRGPRNLPNWIGIRFLARHLVTFDFPNDTMYLKQITVGPRNTNH
jgi:hypothetical protein